MIETWFEEGEREFLRNGVLVHVKTSVRELMSVKCETEAEAREWSAVGPDGVCTRKFHGHRYVLVSLEGREHDVLVTRQKICN